MSEVEEQISEKDLIKLFEGKIIKNYDLSKVDFKALKEAGVDFTGLYFENCKFSRVEDRRKQGIIVNIGAEFSEEIDFSKSSFINCDLKASNFASCKLEDAKFPHSRLKGARFNGADIAGADFRNTDATFKQLAQASNIELAHFPNKEEMLKRSKTSKQDTKFLSSIRNLFGDYDIPIKSPVTVTEQKAPEIEQSVENIEAPNQSKFATKIKAEQRDKGRYI